MIVHFMPYNITCEFLGSELMHHSSYDYVIVYAQLYFIYIYNYYYYYKSLSTNLTLFLHTLEGTETWDSN